MRIVPMTAAYAADLVTWRYPAPYDCYDMTGADPEFLVDPASGFWALTDETGLIGFRSFGQDGQVPGGPYDDPALGAGALDTGGGLRPELTGQGLGRQAIAAGLDFGQRRFSPPAFRMTIASWNARAQNVVRALGFTRVTRFEALTNAEPYDIFLRPAATNLLARGATPPGRSWRCGPPRGPAD